ncbi:MAG: S-adenosylmethionine:tRNA ribosyltransferase-isomerase [Proteiniphilum sp.]|jgi:S-adenosylmethionine:tRNA ribosyltransferase-isomerase|nr:S-adenosylmethionine:tRNA ribosyltransferase-isomerase [Proteiniphilum sp.]
MKNEKARQQPASRYDYALPDDRIAKYPLPQRNASRLLLYDGTRIASTRFDHLPRLLPEGSLLLFNNTRVIHARLPFRRTTGAQIEIFCLSPHHPSDYAENFQQRSRSTWRCMIGNARRWKEEPLLMQVPVKGGTVNLSAEKAGRAGNDAIISFTWDNPEYTFSELLEIAGKLPVPPYLNRPPEADDDVTYQTVYSRAEGSVAAPTAGLHFTEELMTQLRDRGIRTAEVTLHVGAGTFRPLKSETVGDHEMHTEFISVPKETVRQLLHHSGKVTAVGTTTMRTAESLYYIGKKLGAHPGQPLPEPGVSQWEPYDGTAEITPRQALRNILGYLEETGQENLISSTQLMIVPGYEFHYPDAIITNFHQPRSTLLLLISAFVGDDWRRIYDYALKNDYRFLSYGDSSLLYKKTILG